MQIPLHELAALGTATCWAVSALLASDAVRALGASHLNLLRQGLVARLLAGLATVTPARSGIGPHDAALLAVSGLLGIMLGDTLHFAAVGRLGPRRAGAIFALNAPMAATMGWAFLGETLALKAAAGIALTAAGVALAILGRSQAGAHRFEALRGTLAIGTLCGLGAALGQASGSLIARPVMTAGTDPYFASLLRVGASGFAMALVAATPLAPSAPRLWPRGVLALAALTAVIGLLIGMTLFLYALQGSKTGIIATLSATSPVIILPLLWLRTGQRPTPTSWLGAVAAVAGLWLIFSD